MKQYFVQATGLGSGTVASVEIPVNALDIILLVGLSGGDILRIVGGVGVIIVSADIIYGRVEKWRSRRRDDK